MDFMGALGSRCLLAPQCKCLSYVPQTKPPLFLLILSNFQKYKRRTSLIPFTIILQLQLKPHTDSHSLCALESSMHSFPEANNSAWRAGVTCCSLDTINPSVQVSNQISLWQALWDYPRVLWARWAPGEPHCSVTVGLLLLLPAAAWLGLGEPPRLVGCRSPAHLTVRAPPPQGCMARMGRCTTPPQVTEGSAAQCLDDVHLSVTAWKCLWQRGLKSRFSTDSVFFRFCVSGFCSDAWVGCRFIFKQERHLLRNTSSDIVCLLFVEISFKAEMLRRGNWLFDGSSDVIADVNCQNTFGCNLCVATRWQQ